MATAPETAAAAAAEPSVVKETTTEASITAETEASTLYNYDYEHEDDLLEDLPPLRIRAVRADRLSASNLQIPLGIQQQISSQQQKRYSLDSKQQAALNISSPSISATSSITSAGGFRGRSRSRSPSWRSRTTDGTTTGGGGAHHTAHSSCSSLEDIPSDILYDKLGLEELKDRSSGSASGSYHQHSHSYTFGDTSQTRTINLTPVSERMSEDTLEDVHAFSDLSATRSSVGTRSVGGSTIGGEVSSHGVLEPLDEGDEDDLDSDNSANADRGRLDMIAEQDMVIVTNMENITLQQQESQEDDDEDADADADADRNAAGQVSR